MAEMDSVYLDKVGYQDKVIFGESGQGGSRLSLSDKVLCRVQVKTIMFQFC